MTQNISQTNSGGLDHKVSFRFPFIEAELLNLISYYDTPRVLLYGLVDTILILVQARVELVLYYDAGSSRSTHSATYLTTSIMDPTLIASFKAFKENNESAIRESLINFPKGSAFFVGFIGFDHANETTYYETITSAHNVVCNKKLRFTNPALLLKGFSDYLFEGNKPLHASIVNTFDKLVTQVVPIILKEGIGERPHYSPAMQREISNYAFDQTLYEFFISRIHRIIEVAYNNCVGKSPLLTTFIDFGFPNTWFTILKPGKRIFDDETGVSYPYSMEIVIPTQLQEHITKHLVETEQSFIVDGMRIAFDENMVARYIDDISAEFEYERSVFDRSLSSGFLTFCSPLEDDPSDTTSKGTVDDNGDYLKNKVRRNTASNIIFKAIYGDNMPLMMQNFVIHVGGCPFMLVSAITPVWEDRQKTWLYHYCFYSSIARARISHKIKHMVKHDYYLIMRQIFINAKRHYTKADSAISYINYNSATVQCVYPFDAVVATKQPGQYQTEEVGTLRGTPIYIGTVPNEKFPRQIPYREFAYLPDIVTIAKEVFDDA